MSSKGMTLPLLLLLLLLLLLVLFFCEEFIAELRVLLTLNLSAIPKT